MAVHSYLSVRKQCEDKKLTAYFSYLSPRELELRFDHAPGRPFKLADPNHHSDGPYFAQSSIGLRHLLTLHGHAPREAKPEERDYFENPRAQAWLFGLAKCLFDVSMNKDDLKYWLDWVGMLRLELRRKRNEKDHEFSKRISQVTLSLPALSTVCGWFRELGLVNKADEFDLTLYPAKVPKTNERLNVQPPAYVFAEWLAGKWLEDYVLHMVLNLREQGSLHDCGASFEPADANDLRQSFFELDVVALRGYQLFAISCTTSSLKQECKLELIEVYVRARQLGGDEARVALVCMSPKPDTLRNQLERDLNVKGQIKVFGSHELPRLDQHLALWFNGKS